MADHGFDSAGLEEGGMAESRVPDGRRRAFVLQNDGQGFQDPLGVAENDSGNQIALPKLVGFGRHVFEFAKIVQESL